MKRRLLKVCVVCGSVIGIAAVAGWALVPEPAGAFITLAAFACIGAGLALGKLDAR